MHTLSGQLVTVLAFVVLDPQFPFSLGGGIVMTLLCIAAVRWAYVGERDRDSQEIEAADTTPRVGRMVIGPQNDRDVRRAEYEVR